MTAQESNPKNLTFNVIDIETANADRRTICEIGIVHVEDGQVRDEWKTLIDPEDWFDPWNVEIHGIDEEVVKGSPTLPEIWDDLSSRLCGSVLISHSSFDRTAFEQATDYYELEQLQVTWLDSARIARRTWPDRYGRRGYGLKNIATDLGIVFEHHRALDDAKAAAQIVLKACEAANLDIDEWLARVKKPVSNTQTNDVSMSGNVEGHLYGEVVVFTGSLAVPRRDAAKLAASVGCDVTNSVTKKTTILVVGIQDEGKLKKGYDKSSKHRKAEELSRKGSEIKIMSERDFWSAAALDIQPGEVLSDGEDDVRKNRSDSSREQDVCYPIDDKGSVIIMRPTHAGIDVMIRMAK